MFRFLILGLLRGGARLHGYALVKAYRERSGIAVGSGNFYRELQRLVGDGLIRSTANPSEVDARRMPYEITAQGVAVFDEWFAPQEIPVDHCAQDEISARVLFIPEAEPVVVETLLGDVRENLWFWGKQLERERQRITSEAARAAPSGSFTVLPLLLARRQEYAVADLNFIEAVRSAYDEWIAAQHFGAVPDYGTEVVPRGKSVRKRTQPPIVTKSGRAAGPVLR
jgi:DNA-binding PadR family transcriptional regulator